MLKKRGNHEKSFDFDANPRVLYRVLNQLNKDKYLQSTVISQNMVNAMLETG